MSRSIALFFIVLPFLVCGQRFKCFKSAEVLKSTALGYWKEKNSNSGIFYQITFENNGALLKQVESPDFNSKRIPNKYDLVFNEDIALSIDYFGNCYSLIQETKTRSGSVIELLEFTSKTSFKFKGKDFVIYSIDD